jgi:DNA-binding transcriptional MerR regulator
VNVGTQFTIGQLAQAAGVAPSTVRFYERQGLLRPCGRTGGNYRYYDGAALERLRFIRAAQASGFRLEDVAALLGFRGEGENSCHRAVQGLLRNRLSDLQARADELLRQQAALRSLLKSCRRAEGKKRCPVIQAFSTAPTA